MNRLAAVIIFFGALILGLSHCHGQDERAIVAQDTSQIIPIRPGQVFKNHTEAPFYAFPQHLMEITNAKLHLSADKDKIIRQKAFKAKLWKSVAIGILTGWMADKLGVF